MKAPWLKDALIGVSKAPVYSDHGIMGAFIAQILAQPVEPGLAFSHAVGAWAACRKAAFCSKNMIVEELPNTDPVAIEKTLSMCEPATKLLAQLLHTNAYRLISEAFTLMQQKGLKLPAQLLPQALDAGRRNTELRPALFKVLGARGIWLAHFNSAWKYAASSVEEGVTENDKRLWEEGTLTQREVYFKNMRLKNPAYASILLSSQIDKMPAKERQRFLELIETNLSLSDEKLLDGLLKDRSRDVRQKACVLLTQLPESTYARTIIAYMQKLVNYKKGLIKSSWQCEAPKEFDSEWEKLGMSKELPPLYSSGGERSWWLLQLVGKTPLSWWQSHTGMSAKELMHWSKSTDWEHELKQGWLQSMALQDFEWIILLLQLSSKTKMGNLYPSYKLQELLSKLSIEEWDKVIAALPVGNIVEHLQTISTVIDNLPFGQQLPTLLSQAALSAMKKGYENGNLKNNYNFFHFYQQVITVIKPKILEQFEPIAARTDATENEIQWLNELEQSAKLRLLMRKQLTNN